MPPMKFCPRMSRAVLSPPDPLLGNFGEFYPINCEENCALYDEKAKECSELVYYRTAAAYMARKIEEEVELVGKCDACQRELYAGQSGKTFLAEDGSIVARVCEGCVLVPKVAQQITEWSRDEINCEGVAEAFRTSLNNAYSLAVFEVQPEEEDG